MSLVSGNNLKPLTFVKHEYRCVYLGYLWGIYHMHGCGKPYTMWVHEGFIEEVDAEAASLPADTKVGAKMLVDLSKPLIPGCFLPLHDSQVIWLYFCYEGVFHFCKKCGCVGHCASACAISDYESQKRIRS